MHQAMLQCSSPWESPSSVQEWVCGMGACVAAVRGSSAHGQEGTEHSNRQRSQSCSEHLERLVCLFWHV